MRHDIVNQDSHGPGSMFKMISISLTLPPLRSIASVAAYAMAVMILAPSTAVAEEFYPPEVAQIHSGHSLTDTAMFQGTWPWHGPALIKHLGGSQARIGQSTIPGSPMQMRRETGPRHGKPDAWREITDWEILVVTEGALTHPEALFPSGWQAESRHKKREELRIWRDHAWANGNGGRGAALFYYTNWPPHGKHPPAASWRERLEVNEVEWLARVAHAEATRPEGAPPIRIIPGNALMMRIYDDAEMGLVPGLANGQAFLANRAGWWLDDVHSGPYLSLALAYLHVAVIHGADPMRLPHTGLGLDREPDRALAIYLKATVRDIARSHGGDQL